MRSTIIKSIVLVIALQWSSFLQAGNGVSGGTTTLAKQIGTHMNFPTSLLETKKGKAQVRISFRLNANGEKEILLVNGPSEELKQFVVKAVMNTPLSEDTERNKEYNLVFNFSLI